MIDYSGGDRTLSAVIADTLSKIKVTLDIESLDVMRARRQQIDPRDQQL